MTVSSAPEAPPVVNPEVAVVPAAAAAPPPDVNSFMTRVHARLSTLESNVAAALVELKRVGLEIARKVESLAPVVEAGTAAIATAVPDLGPVAAVVERVAAAALTAATCCAHLGVTHTANGCTAPGCSCSATTTPTAPAA
jgi:hypothetical protein